MGAVDSEVAIAAAEAGAAIVRSRLNGDDLVRHPKFDGDFATDVDLAAEAAIRVLLEAAFPDDAIIGEEAGRSGSGNSGRAWLVDPLCGTANYAVGAPGVAVNVALRNGDVALATAVAYPLAGEVLWSDRHAARVRRGGRDASLAPSACSRLVDVNLDPPFPSAPSFRGVDLIAQPAFAQGFRPRVLSSSLALAWVAAGRRAAYVSDGDLRESVHFAAGAALCVAAGCVVTDFSGREWPHGRRGLVAAADTRTYDELMSLIG